MFSVIFHSAWCYGFRVVSVAETAECRPSQHKLTPGGHNVLDSSAEHHELAAK